MSDVQGAVKMEADLGDMFDKFAFDKLIDDEIKIASKEICKMGKNLKKIMKHEKKPRSHSSGVISLKGLKLIVSEKRMIAKTRIVARPKNSGA